MATINSEIWIADSYSYVEDNPQKNATLTGNFELGEDETSIVLNIKDNGDKEIGHSITLDKSDVQSLKKWLESVELLMEDRQHKSQR